MTALIIGDWRFREGADHDAGLAAAAEYAEHLKRQSASARLLLWLRARKQPSRHLSVSLFDRHEDFEAEMRSAAAARFADRLIPSIVRDDGFAISACELVLAFGGPIKEVQLLEETDMAAMLYEWCFAEGVSTQKGLEDAAEAFHELRQSVPVVCSLWARHRTARRRFFHFAVFPSQGAMSQELEAEAGRRWRSRLEPLVVEPPGLSRLELQVLLTTGAVLPDRKLPAGASPTWKPAASPGP